MEEKKVEPMIDDDERKLWRNWTFLKHELRVEELTEGLFKAGRFDAETKEMIITVQPNTKFMKAEKFLSALIRSGIKGYKTFCKLMKTDPSNRYAEVMEKLGISDQDDISDSVSQAETEDQRPISANSSMSGGTGMSSKDGETGEKKIKPSVPDILRQLPGPTNESGTTTPNLLTTPTSLIRQASVMSTPNNDTANAVYAVRTALESGEKTNTVVDLTTLEKELVRIAPTIADLFQRITKSKNEPPKASSIEELNNLKEENERLRKTNRTLIEKLNIFQQQIINLQLENKKLRANDKCDQKSKEELNKRNQELENLRKKFEVQQQELERKEIELNTQLLKIHEIEEENERQKIQIMKLEVLHDESVDDRKEQQDQIEQLMKEKAHQQYQINALTEKQSADEERLQKMEQRLLMLENVGSGSRASYWNNRSRDKNKRTTRIMSPPRSMPWMNGVLNRSHNANVKFNPPAPLNKPPQEKGGHSEKISKL